MLDVGAGTGAFAGFAQQHGWRGNGDPEPDVGASYQGKGTACTLLEQMLFQLPEGSFDVITMACAGTCACIAQIFGPVKTLLKPGGILLIAVPDCTPKTQLSTSNIGLHTMYRDTLSFLAGIHAQVDCQTWHGGKNIRPMWFGTALRKHVV